AKNATATFAQAGLYTMTVTISDGFKSATSSIDVSVSPQGGPSVVTAAAASPNPVTGTTTSLSVLGGNGGGSESSLIYTWATIGNPPADVTFSRNGTNAAKDTLATFTKPGAYSFVVDIFDGSASATSSANVTVNQTLTAILLSPSSSIVQQGATRQFTATA